MTPPSPLPSRQPLYVRVILLALIFVLALGLFTYALHTAIGGNTFGIDFYTFWLADRSVFVDRLTPYRAEITEQSQLGIYKRLAMPGEDEVAFAYPPYALLMLLPEAFLSFDWAQALWLAFNLLAIITVTFLAFQKGPRWLPWTLMLFYPVVFGLVLGNFAVIIGAILIFFYASVFNRQIQSKVIQIPLGILLGWATVKPQFVWLHLIFILLMAIRWKLKLFLVSFGASLAAMLALSFWMVPGWPLEWLNRAIEYSAYNQSTPTITILLSSFISRPASDYLAYFILAICIAATIWLYLQWYRGTVDTLLIAGWCGVLTYFVHPHYIAYEQISFLIPLTVWAVYQKPVHSRPMLVFWFGGIGFSWLTFIITKFKLLPVEATGWPVLLAAAWLAWYWIDTKTKGLKSTCPSSLDYLPKSN